MTQTHFPTSPIGANSRSAPTPPLPFVGRRGDLSVLRIALDDAMDGAGGRVAIVRGPSGVGKSRLVDALTTDARTRGIRVAAGRGFALEAGRPFGIWADALGPVLESLGDGPTAVLARGVEWELSSIVPAFAGRLSGSGAHPGDPDSRGRLFWNFARFLGRLSQREPLLLVLDDAHYADASSIELAHFVGRQLERERLLLVVTYVPDDPLAARVIQFDRSLSPLPTTVTRELQSLTAQDVVDLVYRSFGADVPARFPAMLYERTGGLPFFIDETLKSLVAAGTLVRGESGWSGFDAPIDRVVPSSVRAVVRTRLDALTPESQRVAEVVALAGPRATLDVLETVTGLDVEPLAAAVDALCARQVLRGPATKGGAYAFQHHLVEAIVAEGISEARLRVLHRSLAAAIEQHAGAVGSADVALHLARGGLATTPSAIPHLLYAGRDALARRADPEAAAWLRDALVVVDRQPAPVLPLPEMLRLIEDTALATQRVGDGAAAHALYERALGVATAAGDDEGRSRVLRRMANAFVIEGRADEALAAFQDAESAAKRAGRLDLVVRVRVATAMALQAMGRSQTAKELLEEVVGPVDAGNDTALQARVHRALVLLYGFTGPMEKIQHHSARALVASRAAGDDEVAWSVHWALSTLAGLHGDAKGVATHRREADRLATALHSLPLQAATAEIAIEYASASGEWDEGIALAEQTIPLARAVAPKTLLPRILVWTGLLLLGRDEMDRATALLEEAWDLSGADRADETLPGSVHNIVLAHTGRAALHLRRGEWARALIIGERGLELADRFGYVTWAIHRLLPQVAEASLWLQDFERAERYGRRLRDDSRLLGHRLGLAWSSALEALVARLRDGSPDAWKRLLEAADELDAIPFPFHAARLRRNAAQVMESEGRLEDAVRELRRAHETFARLGAEYELRGTRSQLRSLGVRLPPRQVVEGAGALTGRELEIARFVARRMSNKEIATALDISSRTVSTHLSNIFQKLGVDSRGALADLVRDHPTLGETGGRVDGMDG